MAGDRPIGPVRALGMVMDRILGAQPRESAAARYPPGKALDRRHLMCSVMGPSPPAGRLQVKRFRRNGLPIGALTGAEGRAQTVAPPPPSGGVSPMAPDDTRPSPLSAVTLPPAQRRDGPNARQSRRGGVGRWRAGRGVRRHRHQPALHAARELHPRLGHDADAAPCAGRAVDPVLGGDPHRDDQIRHPDHARRQQGRRRRAGARHPRDPGPERRAAATSGAGSRCSR